MIPPNHLSWLLLACTSGATMGQDLPLRETETLMSSPLSSSRKAPPMVPPIERDGVRYEQDVERQRRDDASRGGSLLAIDAATGHKLWEARLYDNPYVPKVPPGNPVIWFTRMAFVDRADAVEIETVGGNRYQVDLHTHEVKKTASAPPSAPRPDLRPSFD